ncbi:unnamed protein product [Arctogadus glacialis]
MDVSGASMALGVENEEEYKEKDSQEQFEEWAQEEKQEEQWERRRRRKMVGVHSVRRLPTPCASHIALILKCSEATWQRHHVHNTVVVCY